MKILYDYQAFLMQNYGGISRCFAEIIPLLPTDIDWRIAIKQSDNYYLRQRKLVKKLDKVRNPYANFFPKINFRGKSQIYNLMNKLNSNSAFNLNRDFAISQLRDYQFDVFHPTYFDDYFLKYVKDKPWILTIHDMIPELFGFQHWQINQKKKLAPLASHIIAVSERTKKDIVDILNIHPDKISVIYHASSMQKDNNLSLFNKIPSRYLLYVGDRKGVHKNFSYLVNEVAPVLHEDNTLHVICTGNSFDKAEIRVFHDLGITGQMIQCYVSDMQLKWLYRNAIAFIYPSLYEGFGIPILEAFTNGCPVILSNCSCFPEIAGNAALYFNPKQKGELRHAVELIINMSERDKTALLQREFNRGLDFSWQNSAKKLAEVYKKIV